MVEIRHSSVGISVEQLAAAWARQEHATSGSTVVVGHEISGRMRLGIPWQTKPANALSCATVIRTDIVPEAEAVLWVVALVAAANSAGVEPGWPDLLFDANGNQVGAVNLEVHLGPGKIVSAVLSLRLDLSMLEKQANRETLVQEFANEILRCTAMVEHQRAELLNEYTDLSTLARKRIKARLLPKGETRGTMVTVDPLGLLVLESPTGMLERLSPFTVFRIDPADRADRVDHVD